MRVLVTKGGSTAGDIITVPPLGGSTVYASAGDKPSVEEGQRVVKVRTEA